MVTEGSAEGNSDRATDGLFVGEADARVLGWFDAILVGLPLGLGDGTELRTSDGLFEGLAEGFALGVSDGEEDGIAEGVSEGPFDGDAEGLADGETEGVSLGASEATLVGL